jgi:hypothetical protein
MQKAYLFLLSLLLIQQMGASQIVPKFASHRLGNVDLYHDNGTFNVIHNNKFHRIEDHAIDSRLRGIDSAKLAASLKHGHLELKSRSEAGKESFALGYQVHGKGGGPILGAITAVVGGVATGIATTAVFIVSLPTGLAVPAAYATANAGMVATAYATIAATAAPTP